ncbi:WD-40 repeat protein, partial [Reticulomyxa filosa]
MLVMDVEGGENKKEIFSSSDCYDKEWLSLTNEPQKLSTLVCCLCNQIANNAVELQCDEHENAEHAYLIGEECLHKYLRQNNGKCPIQQHEHCEFSKSKTIRQQISELLIVCPRQYNFLKKKELNKYNNWNSKKQCDYKGKIREIKEHLDKSCQLISIEQIISLEIQQQLNVVHEQIKQLQQHLQFNQNTVNELQTQLRNEKIQTEELKEKYFESKKEIEKLKENDSEKNKQIQQLNENIRQLKLENEQVKLERQLEEKKQSEGIVKMHNANSLLKQQQKILFTEFEKLEQEIKLKSDQIQDKKESNSNDKSLVQNSKQSSTFNFDMFCSSSKLLKTFTGHNQCVYSIDYSTFYGNQLLCSGSYDTTVRVWDVETNQQIQLFNGHSNSVFYVKFSPYHYYNHRQNVICSSSADNTIRCWDIKHNKQLQIFNGHTSYVYGIELSPFNGGRYLCSGSFDKTIRLWDIETSKTLHIFNGHANLVWCVDISSLQSNNSSENDGSKSNNIGVIGGNGYTICSGSFDNTIRVWDIETNKQSTLFKGHEYHVMSVKYGSNESEILSGSKDKSVRLWDIRSGKQIQMFNGHTSCVWAVEYSQFINNSSEVDGSSNVICSGSFDNTIRFWDVRSNKDELYVIKGDDQKDNGIYCLKFISLKKREKYNEKTNVDCGVKRVKLMLLNTKIYGTDKGRIVKFYSFHFIKKKVELHSYMSPSSIIESSFDFCQLSFGSPKKQKLTIIIAHSILGVESKYSPNINVVNPFETLPSLPSAISFAQCVNYEHEILICGGYGNRNCYSYHMLKNKYKFICYYPETVTLWGHTVIKYVNLKNADDITLLSFGGKKKHTLIMNY